MLKKTTDAFRANTVAPTPAENNIDRRAACIAAETINGRLNEFMFTLRVGMVFRAYGIPGRE